MRLLATSLLTFITVVTSAQDLQTGIKQFEDRQFELAIKTFKAINSKSNDYAEARFYLGRVAFDQEEYSDARGYFKEAYKKKDKVSKYYTWYGNATGTMAQNAGKIRQGILAPKIKNAYKKAVELDPDDLDAQQGLMEFYSQAPGVMGGSWEKALEAAEAIYKIDPVEGHLARATVYDRKEDHDSAEKEYIELVKMGDQHIYRLGMFYQGRENFQKAHDHFERSFENIPENWAALYQIGRNAALSGLNTERGIVCMKQYMEEDRGDNFPSHAAAKSRLAMIYEKQGKIEKAKTLYEEALKEDPKMNLATEGLKRIRK